MSALFTGGESWGSPSDPEFSMKGKRSAAWGGGGLGKTAGVSEAILNSLSMGGYDAMRANMWGGDRYMEERGGAVDADPLNAGYGAEALTDKLFGLWNDWNNPKSDAVKMHEEQRRRAYVAQQVKNNADWNRNSSGFRANPYGV